jgi:hypothetical protein
MAGMDQKNQILGKERVNSQFGFFNGKVKDRGIQTSTQKSGDEAGGATFGNQRPDLGMGLAELGEKLGHEPASGCADDSQSDFAGDDVVESGNIAGYIVQLSQDAATVLGNEQPLIRQGPRRSIHQGGAKLTF